MSTFVCPSCRTQNNPSAAFCRNCATQLRPCAPPPPNLGLPPQNPPVLAQWIVGSAPECDIVVARPTVSRRHCKLSQTPTNFIVEDLGSRNGTFVNGIRIAGPVSVAAGDNVTLGLTEPFPWPGSRPSGPARTISDPQIHGETSDYPQQRPNSGGHSSQSGVRIVTIGRTPDNDIQLDYPVVSSHHARIVVGASGPVLEDLGSTNGTAVGTIENRIQSARIGPGDSVFFGSFRVQASRLLGGPGVEPPVQPPTILRVQSQETIFGRDPSADVRLDFPMISWRHARLIRTGNTLVVEDLGSTNGTYVNGQRITGPVMVRPGDVIGLGSYTFSLREDGAFEQRDFRGDVTIEIRALAVDVPGKKLLGNISLTIFPSEFVGLMGPSGAGKTTLMNAMNGYTPPTGGAVYLNGLDLYANYDQFCGHIGYVPQNDIMHGDLTVGQALYFTARLRLPSDYRRRDIKTRVKAVLEQLGLDPVEDVLIGSPEKKGISGGQRKRVNLAMELLTDPSVLFLDEPTSGLSSEDTLMVMRLLRGLADSGKTILLTIHQPSLEAYRLMDDVVIVSKDKGSAEPGQLAYFGPAYPDAVEFFNPQGVQGLRPGQEPLPDEVLRGLAKAPTQHWVQGFGQSRYKREYVDARAGKRPADSSRPVSPKMSRGFGLRQWMTLVRRSIAIKLRDTLNTFILLVQAPIIALLIVFVFGEKVSGGFAADASPTDWLSFRTATATTIFLMAISAIWFGCSNSAREIVGEWAIYHRERMVNLKIPSYIASKFTVLGSLCLLQCGILLGIVSWGCKLKGDFVPLFCVLYLASLVGLGFGLTISAFVRTSEAAIGLVPLILIPMVIAGGMMKPVHEMNKGMQVFAHSMASRWAFEGMLLEELRHRSEWKPEVPPGAEKISEDIAESYFPKDDERWGIPASVAALVLMLVLLLSTTGIILKLRDVH